MKKRKIIIRFVIIRLSIAKQKNKKYFGSFADRQQKAPCSAEHRANRININERKKYQARRKITSRKKSVTSEPSRIPSTTPPMTSVK